MNDKESDKKLNIFLNDIKKVCKEHNISISHEDGYGEFLFREYSDGYMEWLEAGQWDSESAEGKRIEKSNRQKENKKCRELTEEEERQINEEQEELKKIAQEI